MQAAGETAKGSKPIRARLMAADPATAIPGKIGDVLNWLVKGSQPRCGQPISTGQQPSETWPAPA